MRHTIDICGRDIELDIQYDFYPAQQQTATSPATNAHFEIHTVKGIQNGELSLLPGWLEDVVADHLGRDEDVIEKMTEDHERQNGRD